MKTLVVYYSKTGNTQTVAKELAQNLSADLEVLTETKPKEGIVGMILAGKDAALQNSTPINDLKNKTDDYDLVVIGTPIWAWTMSNPIRSFFEKHKQGLKKVAFFATMGNSGDKRAFSHMEKLSGLTPAATISFQDAKVKNGEFKTGLAEFVKKLTG
jgi:flavodoxin